LLLKIATDAVPWPTSGLRRASIQSFGFGGTNSHIVLDDAYNFLRMYGLQGNHNTVPAPPETPGDIGELPGDLDELLTTNGLWNGHTNGLSNGHSPPNGHSDSSAMTDSQFPRLLVWSTMDESGVGRVKEVWKEYLADLSLPKNQVPGFIRDLAHTLATRRSQFPWRTFAVAKQPDDISRLADQLTTGIRVKAEPNVAFVFSGVRIPSARPSFMCSVANITKTPARRSVARHGPRADGPLSYLQAQPC
jgi:acyl transferase domain-containing protein